MAKAKKEAGAGLHAGADLDSVQSIAGVAGEEDAGSLRIKAWVSSVPKAKRAPKGVFQSTMRRLPSHSINPMMVDDLGPGGLGGAGGFMLCNGDVWKGLTAAYGECDCMIPGKYHRACAFAFETEHWYVWCENETGDRDTSWFMSEKAGPLSEKEAIFYSSARFRASGDVAEIQGFFKDLVNGWVLASKEAMDSYAGDVPYVGRLRNALAAFEAADQIAEAVAPAASVRRKPGL